MPVRTVATAGTTADCTQAAALIGGIAAEHLLADIGYDTNQVLAAARAGGMTPVIPPQRSRREPQEYDADLYQARHLVANGFGKFQEWAGRRGMPGMRRHTWRFARYGPWRCGPK